MRTVMLLRSAAVLSAFFAIGHSLGGLKQWSPIGDNAVLRQMTAVHFQTMGVSRSYADFYYGFGWDLSAAMVLQTVLIWQLAQVARADVALARPMIGAFILAVLATALIAWRFLFPIPVLFSLVLLIPLVWAYWAAGQQKRAFSG